MFFTVDRIEGDVVVLEDASGEISTKSANVLPPCRAGDVLAEHNGVFTVDVCKTQEKRDEVFSLEQKLKRKFRT